jgi:3-oxoacyl-[acyl-carrier protein] reductase
MTQTTAIVTGAASGVGRECTRMLLEKGWRVAAMDLRTEAITSAFPKAGDALMPMAVDIGDTAQCADGVAKAIKGLGGVDALLHFAAIWVGTTWDRSEPAEWDRVMTVNIKGTFFLTQAMAHHMVERGRGAIVLTASDSVNVGGVAGGPAYVASKGAVVGLTHSLAKALGPKGVRVNALSPGVIDTPMSASWPQSLKDGAIKQTPLGRLATANDVAKVACFLASEEAGFVTGEIVEVNGGFYFK